MNWLLIIVILFISWNIVEGYRYGALRMVFSLCTWILSIMLASYMTPAVSNYITENTKLHSIVQEKAEEKLVENASQDEAVIDSIIQSTGVYDNVSEKIADVVIKVIAFLGVVIVFSILSNVLLEVIKIIEKIPIIGGANKIIGLFVGLFKSMIIVWVFSACLVFVNRITDCKGIMDCIKESVFLQVLYNNNPIIKIIETIIK